MFGMPRVFFVLVIHGLLSCSDRQCDNRAGVSLFKIEHPQNMELTFHQGVSFWGTALQVEGAHAFIGVPNEHFLNHRRRGRNNLGCRVLGSTRLNEHHLRLLKGRNFFWNHLSRFSCREGPTWCQPHYSQRHDALNDHTVRANFATK
jgi:hypothetical protein